MEHDLEAEKLFNNDSSIYNIDQPKQLTIDLGGYQFVSALEIEIGMCAFELVGTAMNSSPKTLVESNFVLEEKLLKIQTISSNVPQKILYLKLNPQSVEKPGHIKYLGIITEDGDPFHLQHLGSSLYLSLYHRDQSLYLHPLNCGTINGTLWTCRQGQLRNINGNYLKFMKKTTDDLIIATANENATLKSTSVDFIDETLTFTVDQETFHLKPSRYPWTSNLSRSNEFGTEIRRKVKTGSIILKY